MNETSRNQGRAITAAAGVAALLFVIGILNGSYLALAIPVAIVTLFALGLVAIFSFEAADLFFIARLGYAPLAAFSFTMPVIWLIYGIGIGFEAGAASCISRAVGRKNVGQARRLTTDTMVLATAVALLLTIAGLATIGPVFSLLGATTELMPLILSYM